MPVHFFGLPAEMDTISEIADNHRVPVIEDAAQSIGARCVALQNKELNVGNIGAFGCFSFFPSKNLGGAGDGGLLPLTTPDSANASPCCEIMAVAKSITTTCSG
jgi:dTDP-4-amino-4,6-dideoxygalactose transaminase